MIDKIYGDELARLLGVYEGDLPRLVNEGAIPKPIPDLSVGGDCRPCWSKMAALDFWANRKARLAINKAMGAGHD